MHRYHMDEAVLSSTRQADLLSTRSVSIEQGVSSGLDRLSSSCEDFTAGAGQTAVVAASPPLLTQGLAVTSNVNSFLPSPEISREDISENHWMPADNPCAAFNEPFDVLKDFTWTMGGLDMFSTVSDTASMGMIEMVNERLVEVVPAMTPYADQAYIHPQRLSLDPGLVAPGLCLVQLDPLEYHRTAIVEYLSVDCSDVPEILSLFKSQTISMILNTYFLRHHLHTPIIHLPTFNVASASTSLVLAMSFVTASYTLSLGLQPSHVQSLLVAAYRFVTKNDQYAANVVPFEYIVSLARRARIFDDTRMKEIGADPRWADWVDLENTRRLAFILYALNCFLTVMKEDVPHIAACEILLHLPEPEVLYDVPTEAEWRRHQIFGGRQQRSKPVFSVVMELVLCGLSDQEHMPRTLLGRFAVTHGIALHAWQTKIQYELGRRHLINTSALDLFFHGRAQEISSALKLWYSVWPETLGDSDHDPQSTKPSILCHNRVLAWFYFAGVLTLPECSFSSTRSDEEQRNGQNVIPQRLSMQFFLARLLTALGRGQLRDVGGDYAVVYQLVSSIDLRDEESTTALGSLVYREVEACPPRFS
ncbi:hypothetical protein EsH8_II_001573 [Colletotrichum jinshuiense]